MMQNTPPNPANLLSLDYAEEARRLKRFNFPLVDFHTHLVGQEAVRIFQEAAGHFGFKLFCSMTPLEEVPAIRNLLGDAVRFIAVPHFHGSDPLHDHGRGYIERLKQYHKLGARTAKFWTAPRIFDYLDKPFASHPLRLNSPLRLQTIQAAYDMGMALMVHIGDPDTWFKTKYADQVKYGTKREQYEALEDVLSRFDAPLVAAHMGGWVEDLAFLSRLLEAYPNLYLDSSAAKWMVREISRHSDAEVHAFFSRWQERIIFGSDIVTKETHLQDYSAMPPEAAKRLVFDLYASRYFALRMLFESDYKGPSPIADPDLSLIEPGRYSELDAPNLIGKSLSDSILEHLYFKNAERFLSALYK